MNVVGGYFCRLTRHFGSLTFCYSMQHTRVYQEELWISTRDFPRYAITVTSRSYKTDNEWNLEWTDFNFIFLPQYFQKKKVPVTRSDIFRIWIPSFWVIPLASEFYMPTFRNSLLHKFLPTPPKKMKQGVPKLRNIKFRIRGITQKKENDILKKTNIWNRECF